AVGTEGALAALPGYDPLMQAYAGLMSINGHPGQEPARVGTSIVDMGTGLWPALAIVAALRERDRTGRAVEVTTALFETALTWVSYHAAGFFGDGEVPQAQGSGTAMIAPYQAFPTADGYAMIAAGSDAHFRPLPAAPRATAARTARPRAGRPPPRGGAAGRRGWRGRSGRAAGPRRRRPAGGGGGRGPARRGCRAPARRPGRWRQRAARRCPPRTHA